MPNQIYIGNFAKGLKTDRLPFNIDNDAFPTMFNFYSWRGRAKRKRGTIFLGQLERQLEALSLGTTDVNGDLSDNLISLFSLESTSSIAPGSVIATAAGFDFADINPLSPSTPPNGDIFGIGGNVRGNINYATGDIVLNLTAGFGGQAVTIDFSYYPGLPVMGLEDFYSSLSNQLYPLLLAFDTKYSYQNDQTSPPSEFFSTSYYKITNAPTVWSGQDYQQFWTTNYSGALWATNNKAGFHFVNATYTAGSGTASITFNFQSNGVNYTDLVVGDFVWFNEWAGGSTINGVTGIVSNIAGAALGNYIVTFSAVQIVAGTGIGQLLTNSISGQDGIRWYDGDPTSGTGIPTGTNLGWVNFAPPLTATSVSINTRPSGLYYLVGALAIVNFKDRLLFFSPYIQTSTGQAFQLPDTVIWSWDGTPYYSSLTPTDETSDVRAYYVDQTGLGGYLSAGISQPIVTINNNEDVLLVGFGGNGRKTRFVYTGNDFQPFLFFNINSELPSTATFSAVSLDKGMIDMGQYGIAMTDQQSSARVDLDIPDSVFQVQSLNNGFQRVNAIRDFFKEWIYFSYPVNNSSWKFPTQTFLFNYRDNTWSILYENFTCHGNYRAQTKRSWQNSPFKSWNAWRDPWNSGSSSALFTQIIAGNPQGYVLIKGQGTGEGKSGSIAAVADSSGNTEITSINHCVRVGDYLLIQDCLGTTDINDLIGKVVEVTNINVFVIDLPFPSGTYGGLGNYTRLSQPLIQTKQFPAYWDQGRQVRLCAQKYLMDATQEGQVTVNIYLSQDPDEAFNDPTINVPPNSLVYSQVMFTCPESTNIGLTPANTNLQMPTAAGQYQIWHRFNTSLIGDTFQVGITLSDTQMRNLIYATSEIALHGMHLTVERGPLLA
jgi:hypothetical protein